MNVQQTAVAIYHSAESYKKLVKWLALVPGIDEEEAMMQWMEYDL